MPHAKWDVFHSEKLEAERGLTSLQVRQALARGEIQEDDLIRPAGSSVPWVALADCPEIHVEDVPGPTAAPVPEPRTEAVTGSITSEEEATEFFAAPEEFASPDIEPEDDAYQTRFFQGMREEEFDVLREADQSIAFPKGTVFGLGPSDEEFDPKSAVISRPDGKIRDPLNFDPSLELNPKHLGSPKPEPEQELKTWDPGEPTSQVMQPAMVDDDEEDEDDSPELLVDDDDDKLLLELSAEFEESAVNGDHPDNLDEDELDDDEFDPAEEDEAAAEFTLARGSAETVEELDLAAMVDVAFQLVLFFLVTATTVLYKSLEVPKPNPESSPAASATQGKSLDELKNDFILVEIDPAGRLKIDQEAVDTNHDLLVKKLRSAREETGRQSMLLSADFTTPHRSAVLAYDAANEIGLGIAIARPTPKP